MGMINSVGLQNPGIHAVIEHELPELKKIFNKKVIANISGYSVEEYVYNCSANSSEERPVLEISGKI